MLRAELFKTQLARCVGVPLTNGLVAEPQQQARCDQCTAIIAVWPKSGHVIWQVE